MAETWVDVATLFFFFFSLKNERHFENSTRELGGNLGTFATKNTYASYVGHFLSEKTKMANWAILKKTETWLRYIANF
jgi:hypothetical protein